MIRAALLIASLSCKAACLESKESNVAQAKRVTIAANTLATVYDLEIGAANFEVREYVLPIGEKREGLMATLWVYSGTKRQTFEVYPQLEMELERYHLKVLNVSRSPEGADVTLEVSAPRH